jgi:hypothetical protein
MTKDQWAVLLRQWSRDTLERLDDEALAELPSEVRTSGWLGAPGASDDELARLEARLGRVLPSSYRTFLQASNGWWQPNHAITRVYPAGDVDWFASRSPDALAGWMESAEAEEREPVPDEEYLRYDDEQDPAHLRVEYLPSAIEIGSSGGEDFLLLNPEIVAADGEWETMFLASWLPGAQRYRSFADAMQGMHADFFADA